MTRAMNILAFDTCWKACSAAIVQCDGDVTNVLAHRFEKMATGQAETLPVMLAEVLNESRISAQQIDRIAVPNGPGSFTGVRIGIAAARALKLSTNADVVTCSSLQALALGVDFDTESSSVPQPIPQSDLLIAMDARRGEVYVQVFATQPGRLTKTEPQLLPISEAAKLGQSKVIYVAGTASEAIAEQVQKVGRKAEIIGEINVPDALDLATYARRLAPLSQPLMPVYLRPPDAKPSSKPGIQRTPL